MRSKDWVGLGIIYRKAGDFAQPRFCYEEAIRIAPGCAMCKRFNQADEALRQAVALGYKNFKSVKQRIDGLKELG